MGANSNFDLPPELHSDDLQLVTNTLTALEALDICETYKVKVHSAAGHIEVRGIVKADVIEVDSDDVNMLMSVSPSRIERVCIVLVHTRDEKSMKIISSNLDIVVRVLDHAQRVMVTGMATFVAMKKRRLERFS
jgi:hypothetical protein